MGKYSGILPQRRRLVVARFACALAVAIAFPAMAQTNTSPTFQGFSTGTVVRVRSDKPPVDLAHAFFLSQTSSNITVTSKGDRYCLDKSVVALTPEPGTEPGTNSSAKTGQPGGAVSLFGRGSADKTDADLQTTLQTVQEMVLGDYASDPGYGKALQYYGDTMREMLNGKVSLDDLAKQAEEVLKLVDEYQPERAKDPRFETQITQLRDFVTRVHKGERIVKDSGKLE